MREEAIKYSVDHKVDKNVLNTVAGAARCDLDFDRLMFAHRLCRNEE